nr:MAG TPA: hypothetical protein [Caudoviricetes sp.]
MFISHSFSPFGKPLISYRNVPKQLGKEMFYK